MNLCTALKTILQTIGTRQLGSTGWRHHLLTKRLLWSNSRQELHSLWPPSASHPGCSRAGDIGLCQHLPSNLLSEVSSLVRKIYYQCLTNPSVVLYIAKLQGQDWQLHHETLMALTRCHGPVPELRSAHGSKTSPVCPANLCSRSAAVCCSAVHTAVSSLPIARRSTSTAETGRDLAPLSVPSHHSPEQTQLRQLRHLEKWPRLPCRERLCSTQVMPLSLAGYQHLHR